MNTYDYYTIKPYTSTPAELEGYFTVEICKPAEADIWILSGHMPDGTRDAIGRFGTREEAQQVFQRITGIPYGNRSRIEAHLQVMRAGQAMLIALRAAADRLGALIDADEDTKNDCKAYDKVCAAIEEATRRPA